MNKKQTKLMYFLVFKYLVKYKRHHAFFYFIVYNLFNINIVAKFFTCKNYFILFFFFV